MEISCCANGTGFPSKRYRKRSSPRGTLYVSHGHTLPCLCRCHGSSGLWSRLFALPPRTGRQGHRRLLRRPDWAASNAFCRIYTCFLLPAVLTPSSHPCTSDTQHRYVCLFFCIVFFSGKTGFRSSRMCSYQRNCHCKTSARTLCHA